MTTLKETLAERGARYGDFTDHARVAQRLQDAMHNPIGWHACSDIQKQALTVIADKIARILTGDPNYADNWHDIQGYAKLVEDRLPTVGALLDSVSMEPPVVADAGGWIEWTGGKCPVAPDTRVELRLRDGGLRKGDAGDWHTCWRNDNHPRDIVAYRVISD